MATRAKMKVSSDTEHGETSVGAQPATFQGWIIKDVAKCTSELLQKVKQDTGRGANVSRVLAELFMWNWIRKYAESRYDKLLEQAKKDSVLNIPAEDEEPLSAGNHVIAESRHFVVTANVTEPVKRFSPDALCSWALKAYSIPIVVMKEQIEKAKAPTKSVTRITIAERE